MHKKEYVGCLFVLVLMYAWVLFGCGVQDGVFYETAQGSRAETAGNEADAGNDTVLAEYADAEKDERLADDADSALDAGKDCILPPLYYVHICGAVLHPGVYEVPEGSRLYEVIVLAGGLRADACDYLVNQAQAVSDGMQVYIPTVQEVQEGIVEQDASGMDFRAEKETDDNDTRIDLNSATKEQLMTLPGIGETRAQAVIAYREAHGGFQAIEELMEVSGIKQGVYDLLKEMIKV